MSILGENLRWRVLRTSQISAMIVFSTVAAGLALASLAAAAGLMPWLSLPVALSDGSSADIGMPVQITVALMAALLTAYMPANFRVLALENSHRAFRMRMEDVANAYWAAHEADRSGLFDLKSEYDAVRERLTFLHDHPDLGHLEPDILEVAAQMSQVSTELARIYSDDKVARARAFLSEREHEADQMQERINTALVTVTELRRWIDRVDGEEEMARAHLDRLTEELNALLPVLGLSVASAPAHPPRAGIIPLPAPRRGNAKSKRVAAK